MTHNRRWRGLAGVCIAALALAGCGQSASSTSNTAKIHATQQAGSNAARIRSHLRSSLGLAHRDFTLSNGGECSVDVIATGASAQAYADDAWTLMAPDRDAAVKIVPYQGTNESACLSAAKTALGW